MDTFIQILDVTAAILIILALNLVRRHYRWWLFYSATNIIFSVVTIYKGLWGLTIMGFVLCITAIQNYRNGKKKEMIDAKLRSLVSYGIAKEQL